MLKQPLHLLILAVTAAAGVLLGLWLAPEAARPVLAAPLTPAAQGAGDAEARVAALEAERDDWRDRYEKLAAEKLEAALREPAPSAPPPPTPGPSTSKRRPRGDEAPAVRGESDPRASSRPLRYNAVRTYRPYRAYRALKVGTKDSVELQGGAEDCAKHAADWLCRGTETSCKEFPDTGECYGTEAHCTRFDASDWCAGTEAYCRRSPTHRSCVGTAVWCLRNKTHDLCRGTKYDCEEQPRAEFCEGTEAFCDRSRRRFDMPFFCDPDPS